MVSPTAGFSRLRHVPNRWRDARVLITGATGFLGRCLCTALEQAGAKVTGFGRHAIGEPLGHRRDSLEDPQALADVFGRVRPEYVFHLAGASIVGAGRSPLATLAPNVVGTMNVLEAALSAGSVHGVVVASSASVYGDGSPVPHREEEGLAPIAPYAVSKACADLMARSYHQAMALPVAVLRMTNLYGPGDLHESRLIPGAVKALLDDRDPILRGDGREVRDYVFVADAVDGLLAAALDAGRRGVAGEAFNLGTGRGTSTLEVIDTLVRIGGRPNRRPILGKRTQPSDTCLVDVKKIAEVIGWSATTSLEHGLKATWNWSVAQRIDS